MNDNYLVISIIGSNRLDLIKILAKLSTSSGCNILDCRIASMGQELGMLFYVAGNWSAIAKLEALLSHQAHKYDLQILCKRTHPIENPLPQLPYHVQIVSLDKPGIISDIADFFAKESIPIFCLNIEHPKPTGHPSSILTLNLIIQMGAHIHLASLRERFIDYCENRNLDATLEPLRY